MKRKIAFSSAYGHRWQSWRWHFPARRSAQDWFKTGTGLGVSKARLAAPDLAARSPPAQPLEKTFHDVLWSDLEYSGMLDLVSPSFYPTQVPEPAERDEGRGLGRGSGQRVHGGVRQHDGGRHEPGGRRVSFRRAQPDRAAGAAEDLSRRRDGQRRAPSGASVRRRHYRAC